MSLATERGLLRAKDGVTVPLAHPAVQYLGWASETMALLFVEAKHVPAVYGSAAYYAALDRGAPKVERDFFAPPHHPLPYIVVQYPFGFYALIGAVIALGTSASSVTGQFFTARVACALLAVTGLFFSYLTFRELRLGLVRAVLLTAIMGFLPLTSFVGSYVQPDNLSFALICAIFYLCLRARRAPGSTLWPARLGVALGCLLATKFQFFLAVAPPVVAAVLVSQTLVNKERRRWARLVALLAVPSVVAGAIVLWVMREPRAAYLAGYYSDWAQPSPCSSLPGVAAKLACTGQWSLAALDEFFGHGYTARSFWGTYGWGATVVVGSSQTESLVRAITMYATWAVLAGLAIVLAKRAVTIVLLARSGHRARALRRLFHDPILIAYVAFAALMFVLFVSTGNLGGVYGVQGRYWFPLLLPMMLAATTIAPLALRRKNLIRFASGFVIALLAAYAVAGNYFALADVKQRFYDPPSLALRTGIQRWDGASAQGTIERVTQFMGSPGSATPLSASKDIEISGWAIDAIRGEPALTVQIEVDGRAVFPAFYGSARSDVAAAYGERYLNSGYEALLPAGALQPGTHTIRARVVTQDAGFFERLPAATQVVLVP